MGDLYMKKHGGGIINKNLMLANCYCQVLLSNFIISFIRVTCNMWASQYSMFDKCTNFIRCSMESMFNKFGFNMVTPTKKNYISNYKYIFSMALSLKEDLPSVCKD